MVRKRATLSLMVRLSMWWIPGRPLAVGGPSKNTNGRAPISRIRCCECASEARKVSSACQRARTASSSSPVVFGSSGYFLIYPSVRYRSAQGRRTRAGRIGKYNGRGNPPRPFSIFIPRPPSEPLASFADEGDDLVGGEVRVDARHVQG